jgi:hypothetical protein
VPGTILCTEEFLSELDERNRVIFAPISHNPSPSGGLILGDDHIAVIKKTDRDEPVEARLFQASLG